MKKLYNVKISVETDIIVAADDLKDAEVRSRDCWRDAIENVHLSDVDIGVVEIKKKSEIADALLSLPYGLAYEEGTLTVGEIWKEVEKANKSDAKEKAHKEWLEKYHATFDFYKEVQNG